MTDQFRYRRGVVLGIAWWTAIVGGGPVQAKDLYVRSVLPLEQARQAAAAAVQKCQKDGYRVSAAVVDPSGVLTVLMRADGAGPHTVDSSRRKAYTAASLGRPTQALADMIARDPSLQGLRDMNESMLMLGGGFPIRIGDAVVGGIGVGGAPGSRFDESCARAGLESVGADLYQPAQ
jgi:uncharacterized protein GlcG (DUF336 family)